MNWIDLKISAIAQVVRGSSPRPAGDPKYFKGDYIPWLTVAALTNISSSEIYVTETLGYLTYEGSLLSRKLSKGTLILANSGATLGIAKILGIECCANDGIAAFLNLDTKKIDKLFLYYYINKRTRYFREVLAPGVGQPNLNTDLIKSLKISTPPLPEQQKIAQILSTWDTAIEKNEQLIRAKTQLKKGLMQQLLTGKKRFEEFEGEEWKEYLLSDLVTFLKGSGLSKEKVVENGQYECILYGELYTTYTEVIVNINSTTDSYEGRVSVEGDILIPASTTTVGKDLATASALRKPGVLLGGDINILRAKNSKYNPDFLAYYLTHIKKHDLASRAQGVTIIHLYGKHFAHVKIFLPSMKEQNKLLFLLLGIQKEIDVLSKKKRGSNEQKKGLMQKLLTGKIRVPFQGGLRS